MRDRSNIWKLLAEAIRNRKRWPHRYGQGSKEVAAAPDTHCATMAPARDGLTRAYSSSNAVKRAGLFGGAPESGDWQSRDVGSERILIG